MTTDIIAPPARDPHTGFFAKGNQVSRGNSGNPNARKVGDLNRAFLNCGTDDLVSELFEMTLERARAGDNTCLQYLLNKLTGKPIQAVEVSNVDPTSSKTEGTRLTAVFLSIIGDDPEKKAQFAAALRGEPILTSEVTDGTGD